MANKTLRIPGYLTDGATEVEVLLVDNGDGTYSLGTVSSGGGAATIADGDDIVAGALADAAAAAGAAGSISAKLRRLTTDLNTLLGYSDGMEGLLTTLAALSKAEDAAHASGDPGIMGLGVRNDTMQNLNDGDTQYIPAGRSKAGQSLVTVAPPEAMVRGKNTTTDTSQKELIPASGDAALKTYVTDMQIVNTGATTALITLRDGSSGAILGYTIAPAGGGSNIHLSTPLVTTANTAFYFDASAGSTTIYASAQGYKAP